jgi:single-stranded-DNA-specific exonuclease
MTAAVAKIRKAIEDKKKIVIFGDYDCDGVGAIAILYSALSILGARVDSFLPVRADDGYGLTLDSLTKVIDTLSPELLITVDCGTNSKVEVDLLLDNNIDVIITDHHEICGPRPNCIVINPAQDKDIDPLCGAGVALKLIEALTNRKFAMQYIDICAISTIADVVPLVGENRIIARLGLEALPRTKNIGLCALLQKSGKKAGMRVNSFDISFRIAPRLNAAGRLSTAEKSLKILLEEDLNVVRNLVDEVDAENRERQDICESIEKEAFEALANYDLLSQKVIVLYNSKWEAGVVGIAAARVLKKFNRPVILMTDDKDGCIKGSCRSITGVNIHSALMACSHLLKRFGGHAAAAGLSMQIENLPLFIKAINKYVDESIPESTFVYTKKYDLEVSMYQVTLKLADEISLFEPFGQDNPKPVFSDICGACKFERIGKHEHLKMPLSNSAECTAFNFLKYIDVLRSKVVKRIYYMPTVEVFAGRTKINCTLSSFDVSTVDPTPTELLLNYARQIGDAYEKKNCIEKKKPFTPCGLYGHLVIVFTSDDFCKLANEYPSYEKKYGVLDSDNPMNTILLGPMTNDAFSFYGKIDVYGAPKGYVDRLRDEFCAVVCDMAGESVFTGAESPTRQDISEFYLYFKNMLNRTPLSMDNVFDIIANYASMSGCDILKAQIAYYILKEIGVIVSSSSGALSINNKQTDLKLSSIYRAGLGA